MPGNRPHYGRWPQHDFTSLKKLRPQSVTSRIQPGSDVIVCAEMDEQWGYVKVSLGCGRCKRCLKRGLLRYFFLEEDKKTAEVSEPATTETPAEATLTDKPAESVQKLTKEEILNKLKEIATDVENAAKSEIDGLKQAFYKLHNSEQQP